ncbi:hypothetical protein FSP39_009998 [Pinctada imbricata]|uniref:N(6)-L-threonylcarbamoyladenine synthase n=1 Tax=Pinctada imbricata TaxID=66713 RepID=A0AA88YNL5_PINIB|nr:hypothetical protein FSP39_009998 [Pinctada imbricata]
MINVARSLSSIRSTEIKEALSLARANVKTLSSVSTRRIVLGIETSCDDTGAAVVDENGHVLGEALHSQMNTHVEKYGGIHPVLARDLHAENIGPIVCEALRQANIKVQDCDAIAVTIKPGFLLSLYEGVKYAQRLAADAGIDFPFLVMLASGGHCLLAVAKDINDYLLIGKGLDNAPGDALDKVARSLNLRLLPQCARLPGGAAIETMAKKGDPRAFDFPTPQFKTPNCDFMFSSLYYKAMLREEKKHGIKPGEILPSVADICASVQYNMTLQLVRKLQRAFIFCMKNKLLPDKPSMVLSGGVASNLYIRRNIQRVCDDFDCTLVCPPPKLCTDNGVMIAW